MTARFATENRTTRVSPAIVIGLLASLAVGCDFDYLVAHVESDEFCVAGVETEFPASAGRATVTLGRDEPGDPNNPLGLELPEDFELVELTAVGVEMTVLEGAADFQFVERLVLSMSGGNTTTVLPTVTLIDFDRYAGDTSTAPRNYDGPSKYFEAESGANLLDYAAKDELVFELVVDGDLPQQEWALGLELCFGFKAEYRKDL